MRDKLLKIVDMLIEVTTEFGKVIEEMCQENTRTLATFKPGEEVKIGEDNYIVLKQDGENTHLLAADMIENIKFGNSKDFKKSEVLKKINNDVLPRLIAAVGEKNIVESTVSLESVDKQNEFGNYTGKMRILSFDEARKYNEIIAKQKYQNYMWTLTPWSTKKRGWEYSMAVLSPSARIYINVYAAISVRAHFVS